MTYDSFNNLTSVCDPDYNASHSGPCPTTSNFGSTVFVYDWERPDPAEPFGKITHSLHPAWLRNGLLRHAERIRRLRLPTQSLQISNSTELDKTQIQPQQNFVYDTSGFGNMVSYANGSGGHSAITYDNINRPTASTDPDGVTSYTCYFADDLIQAKQSALQYELDGNTGSAAAAPVSDLYDTDDDVTAEIHHYGDEKGDTSKWYDGLDRLVEVSVPADANIDNNKPLLIRYFYDLTQDALFGDGPIQSPGRQQPKLSAMAIFLRHSGIFPARATHLLPMLRLMSTAMPRMRQIARFTLPIAH